MAKKKFLEENNEQVWPITRIDCVYTMDGQATINSIIDNIEDSLEDKQDKLTYKDNVLVYKRFNEENAENAFEMGTNKMLIIESLNLEEGKKYSVNTLADKIIPMSLDSPVENISADVISFELKTTAVKMEDLGEMLGFVPIGFTITFSTEYRNYDITVFDKLKADSIEDTPYYSEEHAVVLLSTNLHYVEIGVEKSTESEVTDEFLETHKFVTEEEKINWNNKQDKIKNSVFIKQTPSPDTYDYNVFNLVLNTLEDGLYMATNDLSFYDETTLLENGAELYNGKKECSFHIYKGHLFKYTKMGYNTEYCYITNLSTGIECCLDVNGGITAIYAVNGFMYLDDVEKMLQYEEVVSELYESDRTGTVNMGTSSKEYQFNNAGFLFNENEIYHVIFEDLDGKKTEIIGKADYDGMFFGNRVLAISEWNNPLIPETYLDSDGTNMIFNIDVKNSLEYNGFGKVTILKVEYVSTEFLETHRFITEEEREKWNSKQNTLYYDIEKKAFQSIDLTNLVYSSGESIFETNTVNLIENEIYSVRATIIEDNEDIIYEGFFTAKAGSYNGEYDNSLGAMNFVYLDDGFLDININFNGFENTPTALPPVLQNMFIYDKASFDISAGYPRSVYNENKLLICFMNNIDSIKSFEIKVSSKETIPLTTEALKEYKLNLITDEEKNSFAKKENLPIIKYVPYINHGGIDLSKAIAKTNSSNNIIKYNIDFDSVFNIKKYHIYKILVQLSDYSVFEVLSSKVDYNDFRNVAFFNFVNPINGKEINIAFRDNATSTSIIKIGCSYFEINDKDDIKWIELSCIPQEITTEYLKDHEFLFVTKDDIDNWNSKQDKEDANLNTEDKTIVGAINEINTELETKASTEFVNNMLSGLRLVQMTQSEYDALEVKDPSTLYIII